MLSALSESRGELLRFGLAFAAACPRATVCLWKQTDLPLRRAARSAVRAGTAVRASTACIGDGCDAQTRTHQKWCWAYQRDGWERAAR